jgi:hypothetical protein
MKELLSLLAVMLLTFHLCAQVNCVEGDCINGKGTSVFPSGAKYVGTFQDGTIHGNGTLYFSDGRVYTGDWSNSFRQGKGMLSFPNGDRYEGAFRKNKRVGQGVITFANGNKYDGQWSNDYPNGLGTFFYANGDRYEGAFVNGQCEGNGTLFYVDGSKYVGEWLSNKRHGKGTLVFADGQRLEGQWVDNQYLADWTALGYKGDTTRLRNCNESFCQDGIGRFRYRDGSVYIGQFNNGLPEGQGTVYYAGGDRYEGAWKKHAPHGRGIMYYNSGKVIGAIWEYGRPHKKLYAENENLTNDLVITEKDVEVRIWAVVVGAARYSHMPVLRYTDDDAYQIYAFLKSPEGGALPDSQVKLLIDEDATRGNILDAMRTVFFKADENDVVLFYFSGHGLQGAFLPTDFDGYNNLINHDEIKNLLQVSKAKHKLVVADACHSGSLLALRSGGGVNKTLLKYYKAFEDSKGGTALLMSSKGEEYSLEDGGLRSGIFSHFLVRGLKGEADKNSNSIVTIEELYSFVHQNVRMYTGNLQTPTLTGAFDENMPVSVIRE